MFFFESPWRDPYYNLALEEYLFQSLNRKHDYLMLWQNENSIIVGKYQNTAEEINQSYVDANGIKVARRLSGGGAVYHDLGNLNYTLITSPDNLEEFNLKYFADPVIHVLKRFGIQAEFSGRNDLLINGKKFSGCSQVLSNGRLLYHGCILLNSNLDVLSDALRVRPAKIQSKGVRSVSSRVTTINEHVASPVSMETFKKALANEILAGKSADTLQLSDEDFRTISDLRKNKYATWDWNYGYYADYELHSENRFPAGIVEASMDIHQGKIVAIHFSGDFFCNREISELEQKLVDQPLNTSLLELLSDIDVPSYIHGLTSKELYELLMYM